MSGRQIYHSLYFRCLMALVQFFLWGNSVSDSLGGQQGHIRRCDKIEIEIENRGHT